MTKEQELEKQLNINFIIISSKIKALKATLNEEQLETYKKVIAEQKILMENTLLKHLDSKELKETLDHLDL